MIKIGQRWIFKPNSYDDAFNIGVITKLDGKIAYYSVIYVSPKCNWTSIGFVWNFNTELLSSYFLLPNQDATSGRARVDTTHDRAYDGVV